MKQIQIKIFRIFFLLILGLTLSPLSLFSQFSLSIEIKGLRNNDGQIILEFCNEKGKIIMGVTQKIVDSKCVIIIRKLTPGSYTFKYFHDENKNKILDLNWIGIPKEGFGFSNNAKGTFGPPSIEKTIFEIKSNNIKMVSPTYY